MKQVMEIHNTHAKENEEIAEKASKKNELDSLNPEEESNQKQELEQLGIKIQNLC